MGTQKVIWGTCKETWGTWNAIWDTWKAIIWYLEGNLGTCKKKFLLLLFSLLFPFGFPCLESEYPHMQNYI